MLIILYLSLCYSFMFSPSEEANILAVFPIPSISHQVVFRPLTQELAKRGHKVTVLTPDPAFPKGNTPANLTEIDVHDSYGVWRQEFVNAPKGNQNDFVDELTMVFNVVAKVFDAQLKNREVQNLLRDKKQNFDLILAEACVRPAVVFSHIYNAPAIIVSSFGAFIDNYDVIGAPAHPFLYPSSISRKLYHHNPWQKISTLYNAFMMERMHTSHYEVENKMLRSHFGQNLPPLQEINNNVAMFFLNVHPVFEGNRPVPPSVLYMGGLHQKPEKALPTDLKSYLDSSKNGVIYISFGTNVDPALLPPEKIQVMVKVVSQLPYDVLWKWSKDELPGRTGNIRISKWLPQSDLLRHPKIKLFVTQGGLQSTDEAITAGVPMIGVPMLGDQWYNVEKYQHLNIGVGLDLETLTEDTFKNAINTILGDDSYRQNVAKLRELMRDQPMPPLERAVWWTEHVLRHGGARHLRAPAANISWAQYLELELVLTLLLGLITIITLFITAVYFIHKNIVRNYVATIKLKGT